MKKIIYLSCLMALALTACSKSGSFESEESSDLLKTEIGVRPMGGTLTRSAISGTAFPQGYDMMVSTFHNAATSADYFENVAFGYDATSDAWKSKSGVKYFPLEGTLDFLAVASAGYNTASSGIVPTAVWGESENAAKKVVLTVPDNSGKFDDLLYGALNAQGPTSAGLPMVFRHAMTSVVFVAKCNTEYNAASNAGITINSITLDGAKYSGTLTVSNPAAGGGSGVVSAEWSALGSEQAHQRVRVWDSANSGANASEPELVDLPLGKTAATLSEKPFGEGYVILPAQASVQITVNYTVHNGFNAGGAAVNTANTYSFTPTVATWSMGKKYVYELDFQLSEILISPTVVDWDEQAAEEREIPESTVRGIFTVSSGGQRVYIASGNLRWTGSAFEIASPQYYYNTTTTRDWSVEMNVFPCYKRSGTSGEKETITSSTDSDYVPSGGDAGTLTSSEDWGSCVAQTGSNAWRTLTSAEWTYLLNARTTGGSVNGTSGARYTEATINTDVSGVNGMIIFPDGVDFGAGEATWGTINGGSSWGTKCTSDQWTLLESKGCVFLPAAGYVYYGGSSWATDSVGSDGVYWSSTGYNADYAYYLSFFSGHVNPANFNYRHSGRSVRLVQNL